MYLYYYYYFTSFSSVPQLCLTLKLHGLHHARLPCPSPAPEACSNSCPLSRWCHPPISSSVVPFSSCLQSFPASGSFPVSQFFASGGQSIGASASASVLPLELAGLISLLSKDLFYDKNQSAEKEYYFISTIKISSTDNPAVSYVFPSSFKSRCVKMTVLIKE